MQSEEDLAPEVPDNFVKYEGNLPTSDSFERVYQEEASTEDEVDNQNEPDDTDQEINIPSFDAEEEAENPEE